MMKMGTRKLPKTAIRIICLAAGGALGLGLAVAAADTDHPRQIFIQVDYAYDTADPQLVAGDAAVVAVATVTQELGRNDDRTEFEVSVKELLKGNTPKTLRVSQLGFRDGDDTYQLEGTPLVQPGRTYVMALVAPSAAESQDALLVLSAPEGGNLIDVTDRQDGELEGYRSAVKNQRVPWGASDELRTARARDYQRWLDRVAS